MRDHGPVHLGDVDHAISKFTAEMRQHGAPWQVDGEKRSLLKLKVCFCLKTKYRYGSRLGYQQGVNDFEPWSFESSDTCK